MSKRRLDQEEKEESPEDVVGTLREQYRQQIKTIMIGDEELVRKHIPSDELQNILNKISTRKERRVDNIHKHVIKQNISAKVTFNPSTLEDPTVPLVFRPDVNLFDVSPFECQNPGEKYEANLMNQEHVLFNSITIRGSSSNCPYPMLVKFNVHTLATNMVKSFVFSENNNGLVINPTATVENIIKNKASQMPDMPGSGGVFVIGPGDNSRVNIDIIPQHHYFKPANSIAFGSYSEKTLRNGVHFFQALNPMTNIYDNYCIMKSNHTIVTFAFLNAEHELIRFKPIDPVQTIAEKSGYREKNTYVMMEETLFNYLVEKSLKSHEGVIPFADPRKMVFTFEKHNSDRDLTSLKGSVRGTKQEELDQNMCAEIKFDLGYTILKKDMGDYVIASDILLDRREDNLDILEKLIDAKIHEETDGIYALSEHLKTQTISNK